MMPAYEARLPEQEVCILVPRRTTAGAEESACVAAGYDYEAPAYRAEVTGWLDALGLPWSWQPVEMGTLAEVLDRLTERPCLVFNLCDGNEAVDGFPGLSVVLGLEERRLPFTGAGSAFFAGTTSKTQMKKAFQAHGVPTPDYHAVVDLRCDVSIACSRLGFPLIVKPDISGGSYGICRSSVVADETETRAQVHRLLGGLHGFDFGRTGVFLERFVEGREFTALLVPERDQLHVMLAERVFHPDLSPLQCILSFEDYWNLPNSELGTGNAELRTPEAPHSEFRVPSSVGPGFYRYAAVAQPLAGQLTRVCVQAFHAVNGDSYSRIDLRMDEAGEAYVLEVNANCGLSSDPTQSSVGQICRINQCPFERLLTAMLDRALSKIGIRDPRPAPSF
jgi:D-alanine-D-alanine ligase